MPPKIPGLERSHFQVSSVKLSDFKTPVVLDVGSGLMKAGFAGHDLPITVFPPVVGRVKMERVLNRCVPREIYVGHEAQHARSTLTLKYPMHHGNVTDWADLEQIWQYTFYNQLRVNPEEHPVMLTETAMDRKSKSQMAEVMFEVFQVPFTFVAVQAALALYSSGRTTGVVFSSGDEVTYTLPIYEGYALHHAVQRVDLAGQDLTNYLRKLLEKKGALQASAKREIVQQMKEKCCYVAINADVEPFSDVPYTLPDGQTIILGDERFRTAEVFFKPQLTGKHTYGVHESLVRSLLRSDVDLRKTFAENIVLSGGSSQLPGFSLRLQNEICSMMPLDLVDSVSVAVLPDNEFAAWIGGSSLARLPSFDTAWISRDEYYEFGSDIVYRRCF
ncbi:actin-5-like [Pleurodeles waltl]|uniref:actin-5-like n=1 Tax=Pleurodeles waltl TaxID=8319 RepID=UPI0037094C9F